MSESFDSLIFFMVGQLLFYFGNVIEVGTILLLFLKNYILVVHP